jgi:hypothetical protein
MRLRNIRPHAIIMLMVKWPIRIEPNPTMVESENQSLKIVNEDPIDHKKEDQTPPP